MAGVEQASSTESAKPTTAGLYDAYLGGTNHTAAERDVADKLRTMLPELEALISANRAFHQRATRWLAEQGLRQFVDLGAGLPTQDNTHQVVHRTSPDAHVVYVDHDAKTVEVGSDLVADAENTRFIQADMRDPDAVLAHPELRSLIDLNEPVAVLATAVLHFVPDEQDPWGIVSAYMEALAPGSYLALSHGTADKQSKKSVQAVYDVYRNADMMIYGRSREQVEWFFAGLELVPPYDGADPKVTFSGIWGAEDAVAADDDAGRWFYGGVAKRP